MRNMAVKYRPDWYRSPNLALRHLNLPTDPQPGQILAGRASRVFFPAHPNKRPVNNIRITVHTSNARKLSTLCLADIYIYCIVLSSVRTWFLLLNTKYLPTYQASSVNHHFACIGSSLSHSNDFPARVRRVSLNI